MHPITRKRLIRDFKNMQKDPPPGINASPVDESLLEWTAVIFGPDDTIWDGGIFRMLLRFAEDYPAKPPFVKFVTPIFHPNVYGNGEICLDILQNKWSPIYDISAILVSIRSLLPDPNPESPANAEAAALFKRDRREYTRRVQCCVKASWSDVQNTDMPEEEVAEDETALPRPDPDETTPPRPDPDETALPRPDPDETPPPPRPDPPPTEGENETGGGETLLGGGDLTIMMMED